MHTSLSVNSANKFSPNNVKDNKHNIAFCASVKGVSQIAKTTGPIHNVLESLRNRMIKLALQGKYKRYVRVRKEYAKRYVQCPNEVFFMQPFVQQANMGKPKPIWNAFKICLKEIFRKKSQEEKQMVKIMRRLKAQKKKIAE